MLRIFKITFTSETFLGSLRVFAVRLTFAVEMSCLLDTAKHENGLIFKTVMK